MKHLGDITKINGSGIEPVWCITGGSPCQDLSVAGKRAGLAGQRSGLFMQQVRIVKEMRENDKRMGRTGDMVRPRFLVWENVPGAFSSNFKDGFGDFGAVLEEIVRIAEPTFSLPRLEGKQKWTKSGAIDGDGWSIAWRTHDAQYWGVAQRRRRISVVADFGGQCAGEILFERKSLPGYSKQSKQAREEAAKDFRNGIAVNDRVAVPAVTAPVVLNDQGGSSISVERGQTSPTLRSESHQHEPVVAYGISATHKTTGPGAVIVGVDGYNAAITGDVSSSLGVNCGMSTGRNGVAYGINCSSGADAQVDAEKIGCITAAANSSGNNKAAVAYAEEVPYTLKIRGGVDRDSNGKAAGKGALIQTNLSATLGVSQDQTLFQPILASGKETAGCLMASGYQKLGAQEMFSGDYTVVEKKTFPQQAYDKFVDDTVATTLKAQGGSYGGGSESIVCEPSLYDMTHANDVIRDCGSTSPTLQNRMGTGGNQVPITAQCIIRWIVRRLTPLECTRLQGFPDGWVEIGEWIDSKGKKHKDADSPKYKALGNSIALPFWYWMFCRMANHLPEEATLGSLFDGIGGFPLCWESIHGKGTARWASEIEEFPIAVTKLRFGEE